MRVALQVLLLVNLFVSNYGHELQGPVSAECEADEPMSLLQVHQKEGRAESGKCMKEGQPCAKGRIAGDNCCSGYKCDKGSNICVPKTSCKPLGDTCGGGVFDVSCCGGPIPNPLSSHHLFCDPAPEGGRKCQRRCLIKGEECKNRFGSVNDKMALRKEEKKIVMETAAAKTKELLQEKQAADVVSNLQLESEMDKVCCGTSICKPLTTNDGKTAKITGYTCQ